MTVETSAERLLSAEVLKVKHAPDMSLMETVMHFTSLLYKENLVEDSLETMSANAKNSDVSQLDPISEIESLRVTAKAKRCLQWAQDPARLPVPGAQKMTNDQV